MRPSSKLMVALDVDGTVRALELADALRGQVTTVKVGWPLFLRSRGDIVRRIRRLGLDVFLDGKFHDIPNTVAASVTSAAAFEPAWMTLHASGGSAMMKAAAEAARRAKARPRLLGVTVLTSLDARTLRTELGLPRSPEAQVLRLARLAKRAGLDGVVASGWEVAPLRKLLGSSMAIIVPGVRPQKEDGKIPKGRQDQRRVVTPRQAIERGATAVVVGRPIVEAPDPAAACEAILREIEEARP